MKEIMARSFVHLHVHTEYSMLDGAARLTPLVNEAARLEMPAIAMSDHGNPFGAYEFYGAAKKAEVKPIVGIEAYVAPLSRYHKEGVFWSENRALRKVNEETGEGGDVSGRGLFNHMTMWAADAEGLRNLFRLSTRAWLEGYASKYPRMDDELLSEHGKGIIATTGCPSGAVQTRIRLGQYDEALKAAAKYQDIFGRENYFLELMDHGIPIERRVRVELLQIAKELNIPPLATNDSHYVTQDQAPVHDALLCIGTKALISDPQRFRFTGSDFYLKSAEEMRALWDDEVPGACDNTLLIAERVGDYDEVFAPRDLMPKFPVPEGETEESWLRKETFAGARLRYNGELPAKVVEQLEYELDVINKMGFPGYFLVVADICQFCRDNGIGLGPGRGSATGSLVSYCVRITELDPIDQGLIFERFLNLERPSMPDVDLDLDDRRRELAIDYVTEKYGADKVCQIMTVSRIKAKNAVKDSCRVLGFPFALGEKITKAFPPAVGGTEISLAAIHDEKNARYAEAAELRRLYEEEGDVRSIIDTATGVEGLVRGTGVHAAGVILSSEPLIDVLPLFRPDQDGPILTGFTYPTCENLGLLKMDFLGLRNLTVIGDAVANIKQNQGVEIDVLEIPLDDTRTYELLAKGDTLGVFQLDGSGMRGLLKNMRPTKFTDVAAAIALYRPGPMEANAHTNYALRKTGQQGIDPIHPELKEPLEDILGDTYHLVVFQEQVMAIAQKLAGYTLGGADMLRRAMGKKKKEVLDGEHDKFFSGAADNGFSEEAAQAVWDVLLPFAGYGFNRSHTAGYGLVAYWTAYLKANYPSEYMAALLTSVGDNKDKMAIYLAECRRYGIKVLPPDVNESELMFVSRGEDVRFGLKAIRNIGENVVAAIVEARREKGKFGSFEDFLHKVPMPVCNKRAIESLAKSGALDSLGHSRNSIVLVHERAVEAMIAIKRNEAIGQDSLFGAAEESADIGGGLDLDLSAPEWRKSVLLTFEREMLGLYVSDHPLSGTEAVLAHYRDTTIAELLARDNPAGTVKLAGLISAVTRKVTKKGDAWAIVEVEDFEGRMEVLFFPQAYRLYTEQLVQDRIISVTGTINVRDDGISIYGDSLEIIDVSTASDGGPPIVIGMPQERVDLRTVTRLKEILTSHPGKTPVHLMLTSQRPDGDLVMALEFGVQRGGPLFAEIKTLLGPRALVGGV
jgi:DNA polymerase-3 subunit alpha